MNATHSISSRSNPKWLKRALLLAFAITIGVPIYTIFSSRADRAAYQEIREQEAAAEMHAEVARNAQVVLQSGSVTLTGCGGILRNPLREARSPGKIHNAGALSVTVFRFQLHERGTEIQSGLYVLTPGETSDVGAVSMNDRFRLLHGVEQIGFIWGACPRYRSS